MTMPPYYEAMLPILRITSDKKEHSLKETELLAKFYFRIGLLAYADLFLMKVGIHPLSVTYEIEK